MRLAQETQNEKADKALARLGDKLRIIYYIDPVNLRSEKREFFKHWLNQEVHNPVFRYPKIDIDLEKIEHDLEALRIESHNTIGGMLAKKRKRLLTRVALLRHRGRPAFPRFSYELYGRPSMGLVSYAAGLLERLRNKQYEHKRTITSKKAVSLFRKTLAGYKINWRVKEKRNLAAKAGISSKKDVLVVRRGATFSKREIERLIAHEIETHIFRVENGRLQPYSLFAQGFPGPETTEEGLAVWNEFRHVKKDYERRRIIAGRTLGVEYALKHSFFEVFDRLVQFNLHPESVWDICVRAKRGLRDTSQKGAFTKDHHYLKGYLRVKQFRSEGGDLRDLYIGKINIQNVERLSKLANVVPPRFLPRYLTKHEK